ncbi:MAG: MATE family efflux transporter [Clostridia bacterium]|nr:MATE family efflux transporter [Clostridia bacterium]
MLIKRSEKTRDLTEGSPIKLLTAFIIPTMFGLLFQQFYNMADSIVVGRILGPDALAGVGSTSSVTFFVLGFSVGVCTGFSIPVSQSFGNKDYKALRRYVGNIIFLTAAAALIVTTVTAILCDDILNRMHNPKETFPYAYKYLFICFLGIPATMVYNLASSLMRAMGDSKTPLYFLLMSSLLNIILDIVLIAYTPLEVMGAALATVISQLLAAVCAVIYMAKAFPVIRLSLQDMKPRKSEIIKLLSSGIPMGLQTSVTGIGIILLQSSINDLGPMYMTAFTAGDKVMVMMISPMDAIGMAMAAFVGQNVGAKKLKRVHDGVKASSILGISYCALIALVAVFLGNPMVSWFLDVEKFSNAAGIITHGHNYLMINVALFLPLLYIHILRNSVQAMGFSNFAVFGGVLELIGRGATALFVIPHLGFAAVCFAAPAAWVLADLYLFPLYFILHKKLKKKLSLKGQN